MLNDDNMNTEFQNKHENNERDFEYGKTYYFDRSGLGIKDYELDNVKKGCTTLLQSCCRLQVPRGFKVANYNPAMCFNLSNVCCVKSPIVQKINLPSCECKHPTECEIVTGYEIRAVGEVEFSVSIPICPIKGYCFTKHSNVCCNTIVPVNKIISYTCCPKPCSSSEEPCIDWKYSFICISVREDSCGQYLQISLGLALEYTGSCDCDEE